MNTPLRDPARAPLLSVTAHEYDTIAARCGHGMWSRDHVLVIQVAGLYQLAKFETYWLKDLRMYLIFTSSL